MKTYIYILTLSTTILLAGCNTMTPTQQNWKPTEVVVWTWTTDIDILQDNKNTDPQAFISDGLTTDTSIADIDLSEILDGWPGKDGIPALTNPNFLDISSTDYLEPEDEWTVFVDWDISKFYPNRILNRHEIVNDTVWDTDVVITFCPLCGTSLVFDPYIGGEKLEFWVSGKLRQSNLLMYDTKTESLWSQAFTQAKVWEYTGTELEILSFDVMSWEEYQESHPAGLVLDPDTWYSRNYTGNAPYGWYWESERLYFPVDNLDDKRLHPKTMMIVLNLEEWQAALVKSAIKNLTEPTDITLGNTTVSVRFENGDITIVDTETNELIHFEEMRFSYINRNVWSELVWGIDG